MRWHHAISDEASRVKQFAFFLLPDGRYPVSLADRQLKNK
jgi:hypothetical protein